MRTFLRQLVRGLRLPTPRVENPLGVAVRLLASLEDQVAGGLKGDAVELRRHRLVERIAK